MATIQVRNLNFTYPTAANRALDDVSFEVSSSEFVVLCGKSGCGKSTLLRHLKKHLVPYGQMSGKVLYDGVDVTELADRVDAADIGFVQQNPDNQLVTDKVWHELAFGLESLGMDNQSIKRRVAEMASFFDIQTWFRKSVSELSGGQKQLLNLASIMVMQPKILVLDEPTSQLDPIAASEFIRTIYRINRELGTTIIISEHRLEELFTMADKVMVMDKGKLIAFDEPWNIGNYLAGSGQGGQDSPNAQNARDARDARNARDAQNARDERHPMFYGMPSVMKIYSACRAAGVEKNMQGGREIAPLTIRDGRLWLEKILEPKAEAAKAEAMKAAKAEASEAANAAEGVLTPADEGIAVKPENAVKSENAVKPEMTKTVDAEEIITIKNLWFRYDKDSGDVLRGLNLGIKKGEMFCLLGGNGVGKSTTLKAISGIIAPQNGSVTVDGIKVKKGNLKELFTNRLAMVPQNPQALFTEITVEEELLEALYFAEIPDEEKALRIENMLDLMEISHLRKSHPYDLSGGEQQRLALGKILLLDPKILLLDEPTKGLDPFFKITLAQVLKKLTAEGVTIFMVSHDVEFCAECADRCAMFFDGDVVSVGTPKEFFAGNSFYTTSSNRIARQWFPEAITWEEVANWVERATMTDN